MQPEIVPLGGTYMKPRTQFVAAPEGEGLGGFGDRRIGPDPDFLERLAAAPSRQVRRRMMRKERWLRILD